MFRERIFTAVGSTFDIFIKVLEYDILPASIQAKEQVNSVPALYLLSVPILLIGHVSHLLAFLLNHNFAYRKAGLWPSTPQALR